jgi:hypothetical protein
MLHGFKGTKRVIGSGFGGPALYPGQLIHDWRGRTDQWPYFVMARADPTVDRIVAVTDRGTEVELSHPPLQCDLDELARPATDQP